MPEDLDSETTSAVEEAINISFVETFRRMMWIGAALSLASAIIAFLLVESELHVLEDEVPEEKPKVDEASTA